MSGESGLIAFSKANLSLYPSIRDNLSCCCLSEHPRILFYKPLCRYHEILIIFMVNYTRFRNNAEAAFALLGAGDLIFPTR